MGVVTASGGWGRGEQSSVTLVRIGTLTHGNLGYHTNILTARGIPTSCSLLSNKDNILNEEFINTIAGNTNNVDISTLDTKLFE